MEYHCTPPQESGVYLLTGAPLTQPVLMGVTDRPLGVSLWALDPARRHLTIHSVAVAAPELQYARIGALPDDWRGGVYERDYPTMPGHYLMATVGMVIPVTLIQPACPQCQLFAPCLGGVRFLRLSDIRAAQGTFAGWRKIGDLGTEPALPAMEEAAA